MNAKSRLLLCKSQQPFIAFQYMMSKGHSTFKGPNAPLGFVPESGRRHLELNNGSSFPQSSKSQMQTLLLCFWLVQLSYIRAASHTATDPCTASWYGVDCDTTNSSVTSIDLRTNNLIGSLPNLTYLQGTAPLGPWMLSTAPAITCSFSFSSSFAVPPYWCWATPSPWLDSCLVSSHPRCTWRK